MSYDVYLQSSPDVDDELYWRNYTSNVSPMWSHALGRPLGDFDGAPASEAAGPLDSAVQRMEARPEFYAQWNPENKWGDVEGATDFLRGLRDACHEVPTATVRVSR